MQKLEKPGCGYKYILGFNSKQISFLHGNDNNNNPQRFPSSSTLKLSGRNHRVNSPTHLLDTFWIKFNPVERLYLYRVTGLTHQIFNSEIVPNLEHSLSLTLHHYLPLAGKIKWPEKHPKPSIFYSKNDGVSVTIAESTADFDTLTTYDIHEAKNLFNLTPELTTSDDSADLISIQITLFPNRGFSIGVSTHHAIFDGRSSTTFVKAWAYITKSKQQNLPPEFTPSFDRSLFESPEKASAAVKFSQSLYIVLDQNKKLSSSRSLKIFSNQETDQNLVRATFVMDREDINKLRSKIRECKRKEAKEVHLSSFVVAYGYLIDCMVKAKGGDFDREVVVGFPADYRARLEPPVGFNYFGNCVIVKVISAKTGEVTEDGESVVAEKLSEGVKELEGKNKNAIEELQRVVDMLKMVKAETLKIGVAGSNRFGVYGSDFGWGRPEKVEVLSIHKNGVDDVSFAESRDGEGVEFGVVLEIGEMEAFARLFHDGLKLLHD